MKKILVLVMAGFLFACGEKEEPLETGVTRLKVEGMDCSHCESHIENSMFKLKGVTWVQADVDRGTISFKGSANLEDLQTALEEAGENHGGNKVYQLKALK